MRSLQQLIFATLVTFGVAAPILLIASGAYERAAAPEALGYVQLTLLVSASLDGRPKPDVAPDSPASMRRVRKL